MAARVIARSRLVGLLRDSVIFHVLAAAADEDAEQYFQMANLRTLFSIDSATGSDLDERAAEIQPSTIQRRKALFASGLYQLTRDGTVGTTNIGAGTVVFAEDSEGPIRYRTTAPAAITPGNSVVSVGIVALVAGERGNAQPGTISKLGTRIPGIISGTNLGALTNGRDREGDDQFRARLKLHVQSLSRGTPTAIRGFALGVQLPDNRRVLFCRVVEPIAPTGQFSVYIDDGTGLVDEFNSSFLAVDDVMIPSASGGETDVFTTRRPIRDDGSFVFKINSAVRVRGVDYELNAPAGQVELAVPLSPGDVAAARYRYYTGLIQETQRVIDGDPADPVGHPGVRAAGTLAVVKPANAVFQVVAANIAVASDFDFVTVVANVKTAITRYIDNLEIGEPVIVAKLIEVAMQVDGVLNFQITNLSGSFPAVDQVMGSNQVARIAGPDLVVV